MHVSQLEKRRPDASGNYTCPACEGEGEIESYHNGGSYGCRECARKGWLNPEEWSAYVERRMLAFALEKLWRLKTELRELAQVFGLTDADGNLSRRQYVTYTLSDVMDAYENGTKEAAQAFKAGGVPGQAQAGVVVEPDLSRTLACATGTGEPTAKLVWRRLG